MSALSSDDHLSPQNPLYYAPRRLREQPEQRPSGSFNEARTERLKRLGSRPDAFDTLLEDAVANALRHPLDPQVVREPPEEESERSPRKSKLRIAGRIGIAVAVAAGAALLFVVMMPPMQDHAQADGAGSSVMGIFATARAALSPQRPVAEAAKPDASEFETILASSRTEQQQQQPATREQSDTLLQQFLQWQPKSEQAH